MTKADAIEFQKRIEKQCNEAGIWHEVKRENRPKLKNIIIVISLKVTDNE